MVASFILFLCVCVGLGKDPLRFRSVYNQLFMQLAGSGSFRVAHRVVDIELELMQNWILTLIEHTWAWYSESAQYFNELKKVCQCRLGTRPVFPVVHQERDYIMLALNKNDILQWADSVRTVSIRTHVIYFPTMRLGAFCLHAHSRVLRKVALFC